MSIHSPVRLDRVRIVKGQILLHLHHLAYIEVTFPYSWAKNSVIIGAKIFFLFMYGCFVVPIYPEGAVGSYTPRKHSVLSPSPSLPPFSRPLLPYSLPSYPCPPPPSYPKSKHTHTVYPFLPPTCLPSPTNLEKVGTNKSVPETDGCKFVVVGWRVADWLSNSSHSRESIEFIEFYFVEKQLLPLRKGLYLACCIQCPVINFWIDIR